MSQTQCTDTHMVIAALRQTTGALQQSLTELRSQRDGLRRRLDHEGINPSDHVEAWSPTAWSPTDWSEPRQAEKEWEWRPPPGLSHPDKDSSDSSMEVDRPRKRKVQIAHSSQSDQEAEVVG